MGSWLTKMAAGLTKMVDWMVDWMKKHILNLIALAVLASYVGVWWYIMREVVSFKATTAHPTVDIPTGIVQVAGLLGTTIATITASALGFNIAEVAKATPATPVTAAAIAKKMTTPTLLAIVVYIGVSVAVFFTWVANEQVAPEVLSVYALSSIGWLVGSASVAFKTTDA